MNVPCILPAKKRDPPSPAKADCVSASGKTRPFAPTVWADFRLLLAHCLLQNRSGTNPHGTTSSQSANLKVAIRVIEDAQHPSVGVQ